jgi:hypothetical protein
MLEQKKLPDFINDDNLTYIFGDSEYNGSTFCLPRHYCCVFYYMVFLVSCIWPLRN